MNPYLALWAATFFKQPKGPWVDYEQLVKYAMYGTATGLVIAGILKIVFGGM